MFNPLLANVFAGNALVVKVSEYASWSSLYYERAIKACLQAVGAPADLVQIVHGYAEAGNAIVTGGTDKVVFVGSTSVGRAVMRAAADTLTPVVLELGGKDPFIVLNSANLTQCVPMALRGAFQSCGQNCAGACLQAVGAPADLVQIVHGYAEAGNAIVTGGTDKVVFVGSTSVGRAVMRAAADTLTPVVLELGGKDPFIVLNSANLTQCVPMALRGAFQSCGQNCAGAERFYVQSKIHDSFVEKVMLAANQLRQGWALSPGVDCGAMCMPNQAAYVHSLVTDAVEKGATVLRGGFLPDPTESSGQFYPPTVLVGVTHVMRIMKEEVFGPVLAVVKFETEAEAVALANDCEFGLGSNVFGTRKTALNLGKQLNAGMTTINDFCATYMAQSLPFGGTALGLSQIQTRRLPVVRP